MTTAKQRLKVNDRQIWRLFFVAATVGVYFFALGVPLVGPDEPRYAQVAREMFARGDWVTPTLGGFHWFEKPALLYWLQIFFYKIFGVSEFAARAGSAIFGLLTIFSLWLLGKLAAEDTENTGENSKDEGQTTNERLADWLFLVSAAALGLLVFSRGASFDIILTFPLTAAMASFFIFDSTQRREAARTRGKTQSFSPFAARFSLFAFYFFVGLALLAKGLIGIVFPFAIVAFYHVLARRLPDRKFVLSLFWGSAVSLLVAAAWYLPMYLRHGWEFVDEFFVQHHFARYASNKYQHPQPFWFFWIILPLMTFPWIPFFFAAIWDFVKSIFRRAGAERRSESRITNYELRLFACAWMLVPLVFFSFSGSKLPGYILPALPGALIITAEFVRRFAEKSRRRAISARAVAFGMLALIVVILQFFFGSFVARDTVKNLVRAADERGFSNAKILNYRNVSHNAEFYGAGRLIRTPDGKQKLFSSDAEIAGEAGNQGGSVLVLTETKGAKELTESGLLSTKVLADNGRLSILAVGLK